VRHAFPLTSQGHRYAQFQRALKTGNAHLALAAAAELRDVALADARELVDPLDGVGRHDQVAMLRLERWLRACGYEAEADRLSA
jgi:hypothetical protein